MYKLRVKRVAIILSLILLIFIIEWFKEYSFPEIDIWELPVFSFFYRNLQEPEEIFSLGIILISILLIVKEIVRK